MWGFIFHAAHQCFHGNIHTLKGALFIIWWDDDRGREMEGKIFFWPVTNSPIFIFVTVRSGGHVQVVWLWLTCAGDLELFDVSWHRTWRKDSCLRCVVRQEIDFRAAMSTEEDLLLFSSSSSSFWFGTHVRIYWILAASVSGENQNGEIFNGRLTDSSIRVLSINSSWNFSIVVSTSLSCKCMFSSTGSSPRVNMFMLPFPVASSSSAVYSNKAQHLSVFLSVTASNIYVTQRFLLEFLPKTSEHVRLYLWLLLQDKKYTRQHSFKDKIKMLYCKRAFF